MKKLMGTLFAMCLCAPGAYAQSDEATIDRNLEIVAMAHVLENPEVLAEISTAQNRGVFDVLTNLKNAIKGLKDSFFLTFDTDGNGRIDQGAELDNLKETVKSVALLFVDADKSGSIEGKELAALANGLLANLKSRVAEELCVAVVNEANKAGKYLAFRPLLRRAYQECLELEAIGL